ncbi:MAG: hypothetical protein ACON5A_00385 [Candidatus Comchoanobacterales bacterium]
MPKDKDTPSISAFNATGFHQGLSVDVGVPISTAQDKRSSPKFELVQEFRKKHGLKLLNLKGKSFEGFKVINPKELDNYITDANQTRANGALVDLNACSNLDVDLWYYDFKHNYGFMDVSDTIIDRSWYQKADGFFTQAGASGQSEDNIYAALWSLDQNEIQWRNIKAMTAKNIYRYRRLINHFKKTLDKEDLYHEYIDNFMSSLREWLASEAILESKHFWRDRTDKDPVKYFVLMCVYVFHDCKKAADVILKAVEKKHISIFYLYFFIHQYNDAQVKELIQYLGPKDFKVILACQEESQPINQRTINEVMHAEVMDDENEERKKRLLNQVGCIEPMDVSMVGMPMWMPLDKNNQKEWVANLKMPIWDYITEADTSLVDKIKATIVTQKSNQDHPHQLFPYDPQNNLRQALVDLYKNHYSNMFMRIEWFLLNIVKKNWQWFERYEKTNILFMLNYFGRLGYCLIDHPLILFQALKSGSLTSVIKYLKHFFTDREIVAALVAHLGSTSIVMNAEALKDVISQFNNSGFQRIIEQTAIPKMSTAEINKISHSNHQNVSGARFFHRVKSLSMLTFLAAIVLQLSSGFYYYGTFFLAVFCIFNSRVGTDFERYLERSLLKTEAKGLYQLIALMLYGVAVHHLLTQQSSIVVSTLMLAAVAMQTLSSTKKTLHVISSAVPSPHKMQGNQMLALQIKKGKPFYTQGLRSDTPKVFS